MAQKKNGRCGANTAARHTEMTCGNHGIPFGCRQLYGELQ